MNYFEQYKQKLKTPAEAVKAVKSGDWIDYSVGLGFPALLDEALAGRKDELTDVKIRGFLILQPMKAIEADPEREHFMYNSWYMAGYERKLSDKGLANFMPMVFRNLNSYYRKFLDVNVAMMSVSPMDEHGNFNLSLAPSHGYDMMARAKCIIVEVNENMPYVYGLHKTEVNIQDVAMVVEGSNPQIPELGSVPPTDVDRTVANLIPRFWDVSSGEILIGGVNIKDLATDRLMNLVSFVFQDSFLFYDTIYENIAVGQKSATKDDVERAARAAQCHDFIMSLPNGYDTRIGDWGVYLSGGEAQRICVARAILKNAPILVLDEATAFADPENEYKMQQALAELMKSKTVIVIAHRMQSIISANQIIVLRDGRIEQQGQHITLSTTEGLYKDMWKAYTSAFNWQLNN